MELRITHLDEQLLLDVLLLHIPIESHMILPTEFVPIRYILLNHLPNDVPLMDKISDDLLKFLS